jgi:hypothetical protein
MLTHNLVMDMQLAYMCYSGNSSGGKVPEWKKICVWVKKWCKTAPVRDRTKQPNSKRMVRMLEKLLHVTGVQLVHLVLVLQDMPYYCNFMRKCDQTPKQRPHIPTL